MATWPPPNFRDYIQGLVHRSKHPPETEQSIIRDIFDCCRHFGGLKPNIETDLQLISVGGVIPVTYRGVLYHFPIKIQLGLHYPTEPPTPYVKPTPTMVIRERHPNVSADGRVHIPYVLDVWSSPQYSLYGLVVAMINIFSTQPPVNSCTPKNNSNKQSQPPRKQQYQQTYQQQYQQQQQRPHQQQQQQQRPHQQPPSSQPQYQQHQAQKTQAESEVEEKKQLKQVLEKKLKERFEEISTDFSIELATQSKRQQEVEQTIKEFKESSKKEKEKHEKLKNEYQDLQKQQVKLNTWKSNTYDKITDEHKQNIDTLLQFQDLTIHQIAQCIAEDLAINDTMEQIDEAFVKGIINHDKYLREIRNLSRRQFYPRALRQQLEAKHSKEYKAAKQAAIARQNANRQQT